MGSIAEIKWNSNPVQSSGEFSMAVSLGGELTREELERIFEVPLPEDLVLALSDNGQRHFRTWQEATAEFKRLVGMRDDRLAKTRQMGHELMQAKRRAKRAVEEPPPAQRMREVGANLCSGCLEKLHEP